MKFILISLIGLFLGIGCSRSVQYDTVLESVERRMPENPDTALQLLKHIGQLPENKAVQARYALLYTEALHKNLIEVTSDSLINIAWKYYEKSDDLLRLAKVYFYKGKICSGNEEWSEAMEYLLQSGQLAQRINHQKLSGLVHYELGDIYWKQEYIEEALKHYAHSYQAFLNIRDTFNARYGLGSMAGCYLGKNNIDSALLLYKQAMLMEEKFKEVKTITSLQNSLLYIYYLIKDTEEFYKVFNSVKKEFRGSFNEKVLISNGYYYLQQYDSSKLYLTSALADSTIELSDVLKRNAYWKLYAIEEKLLNYKEAFNYSLKYNELSEVLHQSERQEAVMRVEQKFRNKLLVAQNEQLKVEANLHYLLLIILGLIVILLSLLAFYWINRHKKLLKRKEEAIEEYVELVESLKEQHKSIKNEFLCKLNEKDQEEQQLKTALEKRLAIIKQLTALSVTYSGKNHRDVFYIKVNELMKQDKLTKETLENLCEVVDINYYGVIGFLKTQYPQLVQDELEWCAFLCSGFSPQEMSVMYSVTKNYFYVKNNRLAVKMGLSVSLPQYLKDLTEQLRQEKTSSLSLKDV